MLRISHFHCVLLMFVLSSITLLPYTSGGETSFAAVAPFVDNQTFLIGRLDVQKLQLGDLQARLTAIIEKISGDSNAAQNMAPVAAQAQQLRTAFLDAGGQNVFVLVSTSDVPAQPPFFVVTSSDPGKLDAVQSFVRQLTDASPEKFEIRKHGDRALLVGQSPTLDRLAVAQDQPTRRSDGRRQRRRGRSGPTVDYAQRGSAPCREGDNAQLAKALGQPDRTGLE